MYKGENELKKHEYNQDLDTGALTVTFDDRYNWCSSSGNLTLTWKVKPNNVLL